MNDEIFHNPPSPQTSYKLIKQIIENRLIDCNLCEIY